MTSEQITEQQLAELENNSQPTASEKLENSLKNIYCVSGLGADDRVFQQLEFEGYQPVHIRWVEPEPRESIADYAKRLTAQIKSEKPILIGLSFGGLIAIEIAKQIEVEKVILVSSAKNKREIPLYFRLFRWFPVHRLIPLKSLLRFVYWLAYWFFSLETVDEQKLLRAILSDTDAHFLKWAVHRVVIWNNEEVPEHICHLHGTRDRVFPISFVNADWQIEKGGHLMIMNRASQISALISKVLDRVGSFEGC
ncbi:alpha/beta hydrolase [Myxosarcina sp. GI1]|uniref:thioesterase domain-containing protein n=1 Tax=Myxosarcina sp. GI1 TaxID=1541065 RepID=UPI00068A5FB8|nr:alpha/beta hydrolase [Myxosarcina sp. GI1]